MPRPRRRIPHAAAGAAATALLLAASSPAPAQTAADPPPAARAAPRASGAAPTTDPAVGRRPGGFGFPFTTVERPTVAQPGWFIQPSLALALGFDDNVRFTARDRRSSLFATVAPGILVRGDTPRLTTTLNYVPQATVYFSESEENRLSHAGAGQLLATVVPDRLFLDARVLASTSDLFGAFGGDTLGGARRNQVQTVTASVSPYVVQRFGGLASARAGYIFNVTDQSRLDTSRPVLIVDPVFGPIPTRSFLPSSFTSHTGYLTVTSGEDFGRLLLSGSVFGTTFDGDGIYEGAQRWETVFAAGYGVTRWLFVLGEIGYESLKYNTVPKTDIAGPVWSGGVRLRPSETSDLTLRYGRRDGYDAWQAEGATNLFGPRTRLFVAFTDRLSNSALRAAELLSTTTLDPFGNPIFATTGAPVSPGLGTDLLGFQGGLFRTRTATASIQHTRERDVFVLSLTHENRRPYAADPRSGPQVPSDGTSVGLSWSRPLDEVTNLTTFARVGVRSVGEGRRGDSTFYGAGAVLSHAFSPTLSGALSYRLDVRDDEAADDLVYRNLVVASVRKTF